MDANPTSHTRAFVSECPLPEMPTSAVPSAYTAEQVKQAAIRLLRAAGLPEMGFSSFVAATRQGDTSFQLMGYDRDPSRNPLDVYTVSVIADTFESLMTKLATKLLAWATEAGLVEGAANAGKEPARA